MKWGNLAYNVYRTREPIELSDEKIKEMDFFKSGEVGKRFGIDPKSVERYDGICLFNICWDTSMNFYVAENGEIREKSINIVEVKNVIVFGNHILIQNMSDEERSKIKPFLLQISPEKKFLPQILKFNQKLLEEVEKKAKKIRGAGIKQKRNGRAERVKLLHTSMDLRETVDFKEYMDKEKTELKIVYGDRDGDWIKIKVGSPGILQLNLPIKERREKLKMLQSFIKELIEPNIRLNYQTILG